MAKLTSINIKKTVPKMSEAHNERKVRPNYLLPQYEGQHEHWKTETISQRIGAIEDLYLKEVGQKMQLVAKPIREGVVVISEETSMKELTLLGNRFKERFGIDCFQIHIHKDEGHVVTEKEARAAKEYGEVKVVGSIIRNLHAHMIFDWQDKETGRSIKLNPADMREMQTITAEALGMERGDANKKASRLEAKEFKVYRDKIHEDLTEELDRSEELKAKSLEELRLIEEQKKNSLNELKQLEARSKEVEETSEKFKVNYNQTLKRLKDSRDELKKLEPKFELLRKLEVLPWGSCKDNNVQSWLSLTHGFHSIQIKSGQDGSIYFQLGDQISRLKDMPKEVQAVIKEKLSIDRTFQKQEGIKWRKLRRQRGSI